MLEVWIDGSTRPKKISRKKWEKVGHSSIAVVIKRDGELISQISKYVGILDNNQAEYEALLEAIQLVLNINHEEYVKIYTDSNLIEKQINDKYSVKSELIVPYYNKVKKLLNLLSFYEIRWISRKFNKEADRLTKKEFDNLKSIENQTII